jgi:hypothetical protein
LVIGQESQKSKKNELTMCRACDKIEKTYIGNDAMDTQRVNLSLAPYAHKMLVELSKKKGLTKAAIVTIALEKLLREEEDREKNR